jgi:exoribonuclease R
VHDGSDRRGQVVRHEFHDGVINSDERMTYTAVNGILTDRDPELLNNTRRSRRCSSRCASVPDPERVRRRRGSIDFDLNEAEAIMDEAGRVEAITASSNAAHRLIEEFMLLANETVAHSSRRRMRRRVPHSRRAGHPQGRQVRGVHLGFRLQPGGAGRRFGRGTSRS